jgi:hypothetical protein
LSVERESKFRNRSAGIAAFGSVSGRDVEVGLGNLVPPTNVKKLFWLTCKTVQSVRVSLFASRTHACNQGLTQAGGGEYGINQGVTKVKAGAFPVDQRVTENRSVRTRSEAVACRS